MTQRTLIKDLKTESLILGKGYLFEVAQGIFEDKNKRAFILRDRVDLVKNKVSKATGISIDDIISFDRHMNTIKAKHIAISECVRLQYGSLRMIAKEFNITDHSTVIHACKSVNNRYEKIGRAHV